MNKTTITIGNITKNGESCKNPIIKIVGYNQGIAFPCGDKVDKDGNISISLPDEAFSGKCIYGTIQCESCDECYKDFKACLCDSKEDCESCEDCINGLCVGLCPNGECVDGDCVGKCDEGFKWRNGECVCDGKIDEYGRCVECVEGDVKPCFICKNGVWTPKNCGGRTCKDDECVCPEGTVYDFESDSCIKPPCTPGSCPECQECVAGNCQDIICPEGMICIGDKCVEECNCQSQDCSSKTAACVGKDDKCYCKECEGDCESGCSEGCYCNGTECVPNPCNGPCENGNDCGPGCGCLNGECVPCNSLPCGTDCSQALGCECQGTRCGESDDPCSNYSCDDNCGDRPDCECVNGGCKSKDCTNDDDATLELKDCSIEYSMGDSACCPCPKIVLNNKFNSIELGEDLNINTRVEVRKDVKNASSLPEDAVDGKINRVTETSYSEILQDDEMTGGVVDIYVKYSYKKYDVASDGSNKTTYKTVNTDWELLTGVNIVNGSQFNKSYSVKIPGKTYGNKQYNKVYIRYQSSGVENSRSSCKYKDSIIGEYEITPSNINSLKDKWIASYIKSDDCAKPEVKWYKGRDGVWDSNPFRKLYVDGKKDLIDNPWENPMFETGSPIDSLGDAWSNYEYKVENSCGCSGKVIKFLDSCSKKSYFCDPKDVQVDFQDCGTRVVITEDLKVNCEINKNLNKLNFSGTQEEKELAQVKYLVYINGELEETITPSMADIILPKNKSYKKQRTIETFEIKMNHDYCEECTITKTNDQEKIETPDWKTECQDNGLKTLVFNNVPIGMTIKASNIQGITRSGAIFKNVPNGQIPFTFKYKDCEWIESLNIEGDCCIEVDLDVTATACGDSEDITVNYNLSKPVNGEILFKFLNGGQTIKEETISGDLITSGEIVYKVDNVDLVQYSFESEDYCDIEVQSTTIQRGNTVAISFDLQTNYCSSTVPANGKINVVGGNVTSGVIEISHEDGTTTTTNFDEQFNFPLTLKPGDNELQIKSIEGSACKFTSRDLNINVTEQRQLNENDVQVSVDGGCIEGVGSTSISYSLGSGSGVDITYDLEVQVIPLGNTQEPNTGENVVFTKQGIVYGEEYNDNIDVPGLPLGTESADLKFIFTAAENNDECISLDEIEKHIIVRFCENKLISSETDCNEDTTFNAQFKYALQPNSIQATTNNTPVSITQISATEYRVENIPTSQSVDVVSVTNGVQLNNSFQESCNCNNVNGEIQVLDNNNNSLLSYTFDPLSSNQVVNYTDINETKIFRLVVPGSPSINWELNVAGTIQQFSGPADVTIQNNADEDGGTLTLFLNKGQVCEQQYEIPLNFTACTNQQNAVVSYTGVVQNGVNALVNLCEGSSELVTASITNVTGGQFVWTVGTNQNYSTGNQIVVDNTMQTLSVRYIKGDCEYIGQTIQVNAVTVPTPIINVSNCPDRVIEVGNSVSYSDYEITYNNTTYNKGDQISVPNDEEGNVVITLNNFTVTDANGFSCSKSFGNQTLTLTSCCSTPVIQIQGTCVAPYVSQVQSGTTYEWFVDGSSVNTGNSLDITNFVEGTLYSIYVIGTSQGCSKQSDTVSFTYSCTQPCNLVASLSGTSPETCSNQGSITVSSTGGVGSVSYTLKQGGSVITTNTTGSFTVSAGTYSVDVTDSNCTKTVDNIAVAQVNSTITTSYNTSCNSNGGVVIVSASGVGPFSFSLSNGQTITGVTFATFNSLNNGNYSVTITDANGCTTSVPFNINCVNTNLSLCGQRSVNYSGDCSGLSATSTGYSNPIYTWEYNNTTVNASTLSGAQVGSYSGPIVLTVSEDSGECPKSTQFAIDCSDVNGVGGGLCDGKSVQMSGDCENGFTATSTGYSNPVYSWTLNGSNIASGSTVSASTLSGQSGTLQVTVSEDTGYCPKSVAIQIDCGCNQSFDLQSNNAICSSEGSLVISNVQATNYNTLEYRLTTNGVTPLTWNNITNQGLPYTINGVPIGSGKVELRFDGTCIVEESFTIENEQVTIEIVPITSNAEDNPSSGCPSQEFGLNITNPSNFQISDANWTVSYVDNSQISTTGSQITTNSGWIEISVYLQYNNESCIATATRSCNSSNPGI